MWRDEAERGARGGAGTGGGREAGSGGAKRRRKLKEEVTDAEIVP